MKTISLDELENKLRECVKLSQKERVVVTREGHPAAVIIGVEGQDWEDVLLQTSPKFWKMIRERRQQRTVPLSEARKRLAARRGKRK